MPTGIPRSRTSFEHHENSVMEKPLTRAESKELTALRRDSARSLRVLVRGTKWKVARGTLFRDDNGWFVDVFPVVSRSVFGGPVFIAIQLCAKPMELDPLFWQLVELSGNNRLPLSFRAIGAWTCRTHPVAEAHLPIVVRSPEHVAKQTIEWADEQLEQNRGSRSLEEFIEHQGRRSHPHFAALATALLIAGRFDEAASLALREQALGRGGQFVFNGKTVASAVLEYLASNAR
jgi:hypothetical protein